MKTATVCSFYLMVLLLVDACSPPTPEPELSPQLNFTAQIPEDIDADAIKGTNDSTEITRLFDIFSWKSFIALNWPVDSAGTPLNSLQSEGMPQWSTWKESFQVFQSDGATPDTTWNSPRRLPPIPPASGDVMIREGSRILVKRAKFATVLEKVVAPDGSDPRKQSSGPVWDQHGNEVHYEILLNREAFVGMVTSDHKFYNLEGQLAFWDQKKKEGLSSIRNILQWRDEFIEVKLAWKTLVPDDDPSRFFSMDAFVIDDSSRQWIKKRVGLVGMHIAHRTHHVPQFVWSTFEHIDNAPDQDNMRDTSRTYSFFDPSCPEVDCPINTLPKPDSNGVRKTQIVRTRAILQTTQALNEQIQQMPDLQNTPWRFYQLVGTQYPIPIDSALWVVRPIPSDSAPGAIRPTPPELRNTVIETYMEQPSCMDCHSYAGIAFTFNVTGEEKKPVFNSDTLLANFSWLPQIEAHWAHPH